MGVPVSGWDPAFFPDEERSPADVVNLGYVVNVIEDPAERVVVVAAAWELAQNVLIVSARLDWEATDAAVDFQSDGIVTGKRTFQKFFTQEELRQWIEQGVGPMPGSGRRSGTWHLLRLSGGGRRAVVRSDPGLPGSGASRTWSNVRNSSLTTRSWLRRSWHSLPSGDASRCMTN